MNVRLLVELIRDRIDVRRVGVTVASTLTCLFLVLVDPALFWLGVVAALLVVAAVWRVQRDEARSVQAAQEALLQLANRHLRARVTELEAQVDDLEAENMALVSLLTDAEGRAQDAERGRLRLIRGGE